MTQNEPNNATRARDAEVALTAHVHTQYRKGFEPDLENGDTEDRRDALVDLLANLRHWARKTGVDYADADRIADGHFEAEVSEEADADEPPAGRAVEGELAEIAAQVPPEEWEKVGTFATELREEGRLATAAPELLEACKAALLLAGDGDLADNGEYSGAAITDQIRAAVRKVEGGGQ